MNILGFKLGKKTLIIAGGVLLLIVIICIVRTQGSNKELEERRAKIEEENRKSNIEKAQATGGSTLSRAEQEQQAFIQAWGQPAEGFRWNNKQELVPISSDNLTNEEVAWSYLRGLSILDFSTVQKYSSNSMVEATYSGYFSDNNIGNVSYFSQFLRKEYKFALTSLEIESVGNTAVFADGTSIITVKLKALDLSNKDFWLIDRDYIFNHLQALYTTEDDSVKAQQFVYDYIYSAYEDNKAGKRDLTIELKLDKVALGGWLVSDDTDLNSALMYEDGVNVASYILESFSDWLEDQGRSN